MKTEYKYIRFDDYSNPKLDADVAIGRVMECWHDVMSAPPSRDYHMGYNQALEDAREQMELLKFFPER